MTTSRGFSFIGSAVATLAMAINPAVAEQPPSSLIVEEQAAIKAAAARAAASTVRIEVIGESKAAEAAGEGGASTGLVVGKDGWIVTTDFAVTSQTAGVIVMLPDGTRHAARRVARDVARRIVLLKIEPAEPLTAAEPASVEDLQVGQWCITVGRAWPGGSASVGVGILSALDRGWGLGVQTDASVSPANYGGPLADIEGRVIGVLAALPADTAGMTEGSQLYDSGIGFAVPLEEINRLLPRLEQGETLEPGLLGIAFSSKNVMTDPPVIGTTAPGSPAAKAGLRPGDRILGIDDVAVDRIAEVTHQITVRHAGDPLRLRIARGSGEDRREIDLETTLVAELPPYRRPFLGILPEPRGPDARPKVGWVMPGSPAEATGLKPGDELAWLNEGRDEGTAEKAESRQELTSTRQLEGVVAGLTIGRSVTIGIRREGESLSLPLSVVPMPALLPSVWKEDEAAAQTWPVEVVKLEAAELANPALAVIPQVPEGRSLGVLVFFGPPRGRPVAAAAEAWKAAAGRAGVAVVLPGSQEPDRWSRADLQTVARGLSALQNKAMIDPSRLAFAGRGAGGTLAWLGGDAFKGRVEGVALLDATIPRRTELQRPSADRPLQVLFARPSSDDAVEIARYDADSRRLDEAGILHARLPQPLGEADPVDDLCRWVDLLGLL